MNEEPKSIWIDELKKDYQAIFIDAWSPFISVVLLTVIVAILMASGLFWSVFGGFKLWGDYLNNVIGLGSVLGIKSQLENILMHHTSLMNITLLSGAFCAALLSRQFRINQAPRLEYIWAALGGSLMGVGSVLAGGCTIGGFFTPLTFSSSAGWVMWFGLSVGAIFGLKLLLWTMEHITWGMEPPIAKPARFKKWYPMIGGLVVVLILIWAISWWGSGDTKKTVRALLLIAGFGIGFILHRSRFCFSRVFREPFMTGEAEMSKAMILFIALSATVGAALIAKGLIDPYTVIPPRFWMGSLFGGIVFGVGMIFAGGCASGSLWRAGEGHIKLMITLLFISWGGSTFNALLSKTGLLTIDFDLEYVDGMAEVTPIGVQAFMPDLLGGWGSTLLITYAFLVFWYLFLRYNESTSRFTVF